jgi:hypothetical protein
MARGGYKRALRYISGAYEILHQPPLGVSIPGSILNGITAAYGPAWRNFRASVSVRTDWTTFRSERVTSSKDDLLSYFQIAPGLVFQVGYEGYYAFVLAGGDLKFRALMEQELLEYFRLRRKYEANDLAYFNTARLIQLQYGRRKFAGERFEALYRQWLEQGDTLTSNLGIGRIKQFKLVRGLFSDDNQGEYSELIPWTTIHSPTIQDKRPSKEITDTHKITVEYRDGRITVIVDDREVGSIRNDRLPSGMVGLAVFGRGYAVFDDLLVETLR